MSTLKRDDSDAKKISRAGEVLKMTHVARGLDSDGGLVLDIVVNGHILQLPSDASIIIKVSPIFKLYIFV